MFLPAANHVKTTLHGGRITVAMIISRNKRHFTLLPQAQTAHPNHFHWQRKQVPRKCPEFGGTFTNNIIINTG
jgi:hypothetical protein